MSWKGRAPQGGLVARGLVLALAVAGSARAEHVPIGRYAEVRGGAASRDPYPTSGGDARRTGRSRARAPRAEPRPVWSVTLPQSRLLAPAVLADGTLIVGGNAGVLALEPASGAQRWFARIGALRFTPSVAADGELLAVAAGKLFAIAAAGGTARELALPFEASGGALVLEGGEIVVAGADGQLHALAAGGAYLGGAPAPQRLWSARVGSDLIVASGQTKELTLLSPQGGDPRSVALPERPAAPPLVADDDLIWVLGDRGALLQVGRGGEVHELAQLGPNGFSAAPALGWDGALRAGVRHGEIVCVEPDGRERWRRGIDSPGGAILIDADDTALVVSARGTLYAIDRSGELRWRRGLGVRDAGRPVLARDGTVYVVSRGGQIQALR